MTLIEPPADPGEDAAPVEIPEHPDNDPVVDRELAEVEIPDHPDNDPVVDRELAPVDENDDVLGGPEGRPPGVEDDDEPGDPAPVDEFVDEPGPGAITETDKPTDDVLRDHGAEVLANSDETRDPDRAVGPIAAGTTPAETADPADPAAELAGPAIDENPTAGADPLDGPGPSEATPTQEGAALTQPQGGAPLGGPDDGDPF